MTKISTSKPEQTLQSLGGKPSLPEVLLEVEELGYGVLRLSLRRSWRSMTFSKNQIS